MRFTDDENEVYREARLRMVETQLLRRGVLDSRVLAAMGTTPRHLFVPDPWKAEAYEDHPIGIDCGQTISQPYMVAVMTEMLCLSTGAAVLEIGTGSGYQTAILAQLSSRVVSVERSQALADKAAGLLAALGYDNARVIVGDGTLGVPEEGPYDAILVTAGAPDIPEALKDQLAEGGRLVLPVGSMQFQNLVTITRHSGQWTREWGISCRFVPLVGRQGWDLTTDD